MSIQSFQNMINLNKNGLFMWEKYRHESKQTILEKKAPQENKEPQEKKEPKEKKKKK